MFAANPDTKNLNAVSLMPHEIAKLRSTDPKLKNTRARGRGHKGRRGRRNRERRGGGHDSDTFRPHLAKFFKDKLPSPIGKIPVPPPTTQYDPPLLLLVQNDVHAVVWFDSRSQNVAFPYIIYDVKQDKRIDGGAEHGNDSNMQTAALGGAGY